MGHEVKGLSAEGIQAWWDYVGLGQCSSALLDLGQRR